jgi:5-methylcytosine-specific restriction endonuclease McrA
MQAARKRWNEANRDKLRDKDARRRASKRGAYWEHVDPRDIFERDRGLCGICQKPVDPEKYELDHIIPVSLGGPHSAVNLQLAHRSCNAKRGNRGIVIHDPGPIPEEWHGMFADIPPGGAVLDCGRKGMWMVTPIPARGLR